MQDKVRGGSSQGTFDKSVMAASWGVSILLTFPLLIFKPIFWVTATILHRKSSVYIKYIFVYICIYLYFKENITLLMQYLFAVVQFKSFINQ